MKKTIKKTAIILVGIFAIALVSGNALLAQERKVGSLITDTDLAFITEESKGIVTKYTVPGEESFNGLITAPDLAFVSEAFSESTGNHKPIETDKTIGIITAADYKFLTGGEEASFFSVIDDFTDSLAGRIDR